MNILLVPVTEMRDIEKIEEYNQEYINTYKNDWKPFVTKENFEDYLKRMEDLKKGIDNDGIKEIFYWFFLDNKIIGSGSIRLNPEINKEWEIYSGHIFYQIVPKYRKKGYGKILCHLLIEKMQELGYKEAIITCYDTNIGSIRIIESNSGKLIEIVNGDNLSSNDIVKTRRYKIKIDKSLQDYEEKSNRKVITK